MGKFVFLACPTDPLKGLELSTLNLAWVRSSILCQYFLSYANTLKKRIKRYNIIGFRLIFTKKQSNKKEEK